MQEHMRIGLLDPRWLEQRDRSIREKQSDDEVYAPGQLEHPTHLGKPEFLHEFCELFRCPLAPPAPTEEEHLQYGFLRDVLSVLIMWMHLLLVH